MAEILFAGGVRTVTGSMHLLRTAKAQVLLDCGLFEGSRRDAYEHNRAQARLAPNADALVLSHAHMDHSGNIPTLIKAGFQGSIWATSATRDLCAAMLRDSAHIQEEDAAYLNKKRQRRGEGPVQPLYTRAEADASLGSFVGISYNRTFQVAPGVNATLLDAGHILGSSLVSLEIEDVGGALRVGYTGDLGRRGQHILRDPELLRGLDYLIIESTYGARLRESAEASRATLRRVINETYQRGGKIIIPAFAVGRTQEVVYDLYLLSRDHKVPQLSIYVDSPLAVDVTEIFRLHAECYDEEMRQLLQESRFGPLGFSRLHYVRAVEESKALNFLREPAIIISASGMAEAGRILHHLKVNIGDERNTVLFVGYQAENTLGRRIQEGAPRVRIFDEEHVVRARIESIEGYSAHADRQELVDYADAVARNSSLKGIFVVHGEEEASIALVEALQERRLPNVSAPKPMDVVTL